MTNLPDIPLPSTIRARFVENINGLRMHVLEAGVETSNRPCLLLFHGFPELAYRWRKVMRPLAAAGFRMIAPDQRGYRRTTRWDRRYNGDVAFIPFVRPDPGRAWGWSSALGYRSVAAVNGHDFGSPVAAWCSLLRPDVIPAVAMMSAPFRRPALGLNASAPVEETRSRRELAKLDRPRKHYQWYFSTSRGEHQHARLPATHPRFPARLLPLKRPVRAGNKPRTARISSIASAHARAAASTLASTSGGQSP